MENTEFNHRLANINAINALTLDAINSVEYYSLSNVFEEEMDELDNNELTEFARKHNIIKPSARLVFVKIPMFDDLTTRQFNSLVDAPISGYTNLNFHDVYDELILDILSKQTKPTDNFDALTQDALYLIDNDKALIVNERSLVGLLEAHMLLDEYKNMSVEDSFEAAEDYAPSFTRADLLSDTDEKFVFFEQ
jgi:hypothetical protein